MLLIKIVSDLLIKDSSILKLVSVIASNSLCALKR